MSSVINYNQGKDHIPQMEDLLSSEDLADSNKCHLHFALSKAYEDLNDLKTNYTHLHTGNALRKKLLKYDVSQDIELFEAIKLNTPSLSR